MDWFLLVVGILLALIILGLSTYLVILYSSPMDQNMAWLPKIIVVLGFSLACCTVLLLPFDVANRRDPTSMQRLGGGLDTELMWQIILWSVVSFVVVIIPFATFYYEAFDPDHGHSCIQQITPAVLYTFMCIFFFFGLSAVLWVTVGDAVIPYLSYTGHYICNDVRTVSEFYTASTTEKLTLKVSFFVYVIAMLAAIGWILFFVYGGVGLTALPVDLLTEFMERPKPIGKVEFDREKEVVAAKAQGLLALGAKLREKVRKKNNTKVRNEINRFRAETLELEKNLDKLEVAYQQSGGNPLVVFGVLFLGILGFGMSILWILHIFLFNTLRVNPFLNTMLIDLDGAFSLLGVIAYGVLSFYLLWCTVKGCIKVGIRIVFFQIHPMKVNDTLMNSMLFNAGLVLLCGVSVTQFCAQSFREYAANTAIDTLLNVYVFRLKGIGYMIFLMQFFFVAIAILSIFWIMLCPKSKKKKKDDDDDD